MMDENFSDRMSIISAYKFLWIPRALVALVLILWFFVVLPLSVLEGYGYGGGILSPIVMISLSFVISDIFSFFLKNKSFLASANSSLGCLLGSVLRVAMRCSLGAHRWNFPKKTPLPRQ